MKKLTILTSVLALAACGGGNNAPVVPDSGMRVSSDAIASNQNVTSMASEILIAKDGTAPNIVRSASVVNGGTEYIAYHLDDAKFFDNHMDSADEYISFGIDENNGQINNMSYHWKENNSDMVESVNRESSDNSVFTENVYKFHVTVGMNTYYTDSLVPGQYSKEQIKEAFHDAYDGEISDDILLDIEAAVDATDMVPTEYVHRHVIDLQGNDMPESNKLRYSDFGYTTILAKEIHEEGDGVGDDNSVIFGGYEIKEIQNPNLTNGMTFSGKAVAALGVVHENAVKKIETGDTDTTLTIDANGKETLTMPFNNYYTISVEKPQNADETISWTGTTTIGYALDGNQPVNNQQINMKYYGDTTTPSEVVGGVKFQNNNVEFNGAFGVKN